MNNSSDKQVKIPFGNRIDSISIKGNRLVDVLSPQPIDISLDQRKIVREMLLNPIGCKPLAEILKPTDRIAIISEDNSRFARTDIIIEELIDYLEEIGIKDNRIQIIMALGSHRKMTEDEIREKIGEKNFSRLRCVNSEFRDPSLLVDMGKAPGGVQILLDKRVADAEIKIGIGSIVPHPALGYSGGAKILYPGTVGETTVAQLHFRSALIGQNIMGVVENKARIEMEQWVDTIGLDFIINAVVTPDNRTYRIVAGDYKIAHRVGVDYADDIYKLRAKSPVDYLIACSHSADMDLWQATKAIIGGERIVKDGGRIILYTPCPEGVGPHKNFSKYCIGGKNDSKKLSLSELDLPNEEILPFSVGALVARVQKRINVDIVSPGISPAIASEAGFNYAGATLADLQKLINNHDQGSTISVLTHGGESFALL
jgi:nickel-dependent lactate racemase